MKFKVLSVFILLAGLIVGVIVVRQRQIFRQRAAVFPKTASLTFSPTVLGSIPVGGSFNLDIILAIPQSSSFPGAVAADILIRFDRTKLELTNIAKPINTSLVNVFRTYAPIIPQGQTNEGTFDITRVITCANGGGTNCPSGQGVVELGIVAFDWPANILTGSFTGSGTVASLTFKAIDTGGAIVRFIPSSGFTDIGFSVTTDSNVVVNPTDGSGPEDILILPTDTRTVTISGTSTPIPTGAACIPTDGDANGDGIATGADVIIWAVHYQHGHLGPGHADFNCSGNTDGFDVVIWAVNYR